LDLPARGLKTEHLHFDRVGARFKIGEVVAAGLVGGCYHALIVFDGDHRGSGHRLTAELHHAGLSADRAAEGQQENKRPWH
jgi:hypothetical protein